MCTCVRVYMCLSVGLCVSEIVFQSVCVCVCTDGAVAGDLASLRVVSQQLQLSFGGLPCGELLPHTCRGRQRPEEQQMEGFSSLQ